MEMGTACLIKRTLPLRAWAAWLNVSDRVCGKRRTCARQAGAGDTGAG